MSKKESSLKSQYSISLWIFILYNFLLFLFIFNSKQINYSELSSYNFLFNKNNIIIASVYPIITIIINGLLPPNFKSMIVFWRIKYPLPGFRVFSKISKKDHRIDLEKLKYKFGTLPKDPVKQNQLWYKIYKQNESKITVKDAHKNFLFCRDLTALSFLFCATFNIALIISKGIFFNIYYSLFLFFQYIILAIVAKNYGNRFVCNVLAEESSKN